MTYRAYIKKDYKPVAGREISQPQRRLTGPVIILGISAILVFLAVGNDSENDVVKVSGNSAIPLQVIPLTSPVVSARQPASQLTATDAIEADTVPVVNESISTEVRPAWQSVKIGKGENLSLIFERLGLGPGVVYAVVNAGKPAQMLKNLMPGQELNFLIDDGKLQSLAFEPSLTERLEISKTRLGSASRKMRRCTRSWKRKLHALSKPRKKNKKKLRNFTMLKKNSMILTLKTPSEEVG